MSYQTAKILKIENIIDETKDENLCFFGHSSHFDIHPYIIDLVIDHITWQESEKILFLSPHFVELINLFTALKNNAETFDWKYETHKDETFRLYADDTSIVEMVQVKDEFFFHLKENYYDLVVLYDMSDLISFETLSKLIHASKKLYVTVIDSPDSVIYSENMSSFFYRIENECKENNFTDYYQYRKVLGSFEGFPKEAF